MATYDAGIVTAYGAAVRGGYTGTYEEFCAQQANYAASAAAVEQAKEDVEELIESIPSDYSQLSDDVEAMTTATTADVGKALKAKTVSNGKVTEWEFGEAGGGLSEDIKQALLQIAEKVAYIDEDGQDYYDDLYDALYPPKPATGISLNQSSLSFGTLGVTQQLTATVTPSDSSDRVVWTSSNPSVATVSNTGLVASVAYGSATITATAGSVSATCSVTIAQATLTSIDAVYTQSGTVYDTDSLDTLKTDLVVTAHWSDSSTSTVPSADYTLSGTLEVGTSTITVSYNGKTTTFTVTVSSDNRFPLTYQGNFTNATPSSKRVTLGLEDMTLEYGQTLTVNVENGYVLYPLEEYGAGNDESLVRTAKAAGQIYVYGTNTSTGFVYGTSDIVCGTQSTAKIKTTTGWNTTKEYSIQNSAVLSVAFSGVAFFIEKGNTNAHGNEDITIDEAKNAISWSIT